MAARRQRRVAAEPPPSEGYLGSVSDLMAALIFVFILTVAVFALRLAKDQQTVKTTRESRKDMLEQIEERLRERGIKVIVDADQGVLRIRENAIYFDSGAAWPSPETVRNVGKIGRVLAEVLPCYVARRDASAVALASLPQFCDTSPREPLDCASRQNVGGVETALIEGHTDPRPIRGGFRDNLDLSSARAGQVFRMMTECEPELELLFNSSQLRVLGVSGYAERRPASDRDDENRRIDLRFMMELPRLDFGAAGVIDAARQRGAQ